MKAVSKAFPLAALSAALIVASLATLSPARAQSADPDPETDTEAAKGGKNDADDDANAFRFGGRVHYDLVRFDEDVTSLPDRNDVRRARVSVSGKFAEDWRYRAEYDFGGTSKGWKSVWLSYRGFDRWDVRAGHLVAPVGMEQLMGSGDMPLMERSMASALSPGFLLGGQATYARRGWTGTLGYYGNPLDNEQDASGQDGHGLAGRVSFAPLRKKGKALHLGASFEDRSVARVAPPGGYRISARPGSGLAERTLIATGAIAGVDRTRTWGAEAGALVGPVTLLAESLRTQVERDAGADLNFDGWHVTASWMLTGERRRYNDAAGVFGRIRPQRPWGALELAARYDRLDLQDGDVEGGRERNVAYGLNWYFRDHLRVMLDHVDARAEPNRRGVPESVGIDQMRVQIDF